MSVSTVVHATCSRSWQAQNAIFLYVEQQHKKFVNILPEYFNQIYSAP